jgi:hypothetical protein
MDLVKKYYDTILKEDIFDSSELCLFITKKDNDERFDDEDYLLSEGNKYTYRVQQGPCHAPINTSGIVEYYQILSIDRDVFYWEYSLDECGEDRRHKVMAYWKWLCEESPLSDAIVGSIKEYKGITYVGPIKSTEVSVAFGVMLRMGWEYRVEVENWYGMVNTFGISKELAFVLAFSMQVDLTEDIQRISLYSTRYTDHHYPFYCEESSAAEVSEWVRGVRTGVSSTEVESESKTISGWTRRMYKDLWGGDSFHGFLVNIANRIVTKGAPTFTDEQRAADIFGVFREKREKDSFVFSGMDECCEFIYQVKKELDML